MSAEDRHVSRRRWSRPTGQKRTLPAQPGAPTGQKRTLPAQPGAGSPGTLGPEAPEPTRHQRGVPDGVLDVPVSEVVLNQPRVRPSVGEVEARRVSQHVRVDREGEPGPLASASGELPHPGPGAPSPPPAQENTSP